MTFLPAQYDDAQAAPAHWRFTELPAENLRLLTPDFTRDELRDMVMELMG